MIGEPIDMANQSDRAVKPDYLHGFGNEHESEALPGALPIGRRSPQRPAYGLYAEQLSGTAFTAPRASNLRTWFYRIRPSARRSGLEPVSHASWQTAPLAEIATPPVQLRWSPFPIPEGDADFIDGLTTLAANGNADLQVGIGIHVYRCNRSMGRRYVLNADADMLIVPQQGALRVHTECGVLEGNPGEMVLVPRGIVFRIDLLDEAGRGYVCENYGAAFRLPERGPVGSDGFANQRDFMVPTAAYEDDENDCRLTVKFGGRFSEAEIGYSPLDVVAWWGNYTPYKYDLARFNTIGTISYDHPDPSIYTVLSAPSDTPGVANCDFVIFPPRWLVAEDTFRPPPFHRNVMSEFMGLITGVYDGKPGPGGFEPGGASLHNSMIPHGPDSEAHARATAAELAPRHLDDTLAFMFESRYVIHPTRWALESPQLQGNYQECWSGLEKKFTGEP